MLGCAQTGTGKTAAFLLPILQRSDGKKRFRHPRALVLTPTRELAAQIDTAAEAYGHFLDLRHGVIFGGVSQRPQTAMLRKGVDVLVATPGRLLDLLGQGFVDLARVEFFVLDEADRMLDMGFIRDVKRVLAALPKERQNLLFSATTEPRIEKLARGFMDEPVFVSVGETNTRAEGIDQRVIFAAKGDKRDVLVGLLDEWQTEGAIVFTRTKHRANRLAKQLTNAGHPAEPIHGNKSQGARTRALNGFRAGTVRILVATDLASRGIDVEHVTHVVNFELPNEPASYVHRIGRTARGGRSGTAVALCAPDERPLLKAIERLLGERIPSSGSGAPTSDPEPRDERDDRDSRPRRTNRRRSRSSKQNSKAPAKSRSKGRSRSKEGSKPRSKEGSKPRAKDGSKPRSKDGSKPRAKDGPKSQPRAKSRRRRGRRDASAPAIPTFGQGRS